MNMKIWVKMHCFKKLCMFIIMYYHSYFNWHCIIKWVVQLQKCEHDNTSIQISLVYKSPGEQIHFFRDFRPY